MSTVFICRCHDEQKQGAAIPGEPGLTEWFMAHDICYGIMTAFRDSPQCSRLLEGTLRERCSTISRHCCPDDVAVEVHGNSMPGNPDVSGYFCMVADGACRAEEAGNYVLDAISPVLLHSVGCGICRVTETERWVGHRRHYRPVSPRVSRLALLLDTPCPAVIVEAGFLSNPGEARWLRSAANRQRLGRAIGDGVEAYLSRTTEES